MVVWHDQAHRLNCINISKRSRLMSLFRKNSFQTGCRRASLTMSNTGIWWVEGGEGEGRGEGGERGGRGREKGES